MGLSPFSPPVTLGTQILLGPRYPEDWRNAVLFGPQVPLGLVRLSPFSRPGTLCLPPGTLGTGGTLYFQSPRYGTGGTQSFQAPLGTLETGGTLAPSGAQAP